MIHKFYVNIFVFFAESENQSVAKNPNDMMPINTSDVFNDHQKNHTEMMDMAETDAIVALDTKGNQSSVDNHKVSITTTISDGSKKPNKDDFPEEENMCNSSASETVNGGQLASCEQNELGSTAVIAQDMQENLPLINIQEVSNSNSALDSFKSKSDDVVIVFEMGAITTTEIIAALNEIQPPTDNQVMPPTNMIPNDSKESRQDALDSKEANNMFKASVSEMGANTTTEIIAALNESQPPTDYQVVASESTNSNDLKESCEDAMDSNEEKDMLKPFVSEILNEEQTSVEKQNEMDPNVTTDREESITRAR